MKKLGMYAALITLVVASSFAATPGRQKASSTSKPVIVTLVRWPYT